MVCMQPIVCRGINNTHEIPSLHWHERCKHVQFFTNRSRLEMQNFSHRSKRSHVEAPDRGGSILDGVYVLSDAELVNSSVHEYILVVSCRPFFFHIYIVIVYTRCLFQLLFLAMANSHRRAKCVCAIRDLAVFMDHGQNGARAMSLANSEDK